MLRELKNEGFASIIEVVVTSVIFIVTTFGIMAAISSMSPLSDQSFDDVQGQYVAEDFSRRLTSNVSASQWQNASSPIAPGVLYNGAYTITEMDTSGLGGTDAYTYNYILEDVAGYPAGEAPRKLTINMTVSEQ